MDGAGPSNVAPQAVEAPAPPVVEAPAPPVDEVVAVPMEPMSPALPPPPPRFWCDFCKEFTPIPHTLEYSYSLPAPAPVAPAEVAIPGGALDPCVGSFLGPTHECARSRSERRSSLQHLLRRSVERSPGRDPVRACIQRFALGSAGQLGRPLTP